MKDFSEAFYSSSKEYILGLIPRLMAVASPSGYTAKASTFVIDELAKFGFDASLTAKGCVSVSVGGEGEALVLSAHLDTLGAMVSEIRPNGNLRLSPIGGLNPHNIEGENFTVFPRFPDGKLKGEALSGAFQLEDPSIHVNREYSNRERNFMTMELVPDAVTSSKEETEALGISVGDFCSPDPRTVITSGGFVKSRFLDDKLSVVILLALAKSISEGKLSPARKLHLYFTVFEEIGHGCSSLPFETSELISVDMGCVGSLVSCTERQVSICAKDSAGPSNYELTNALISCARENKVDYAVDIYPGYSSDADAALRAGYDLRHCVVGSGVFASHGYERTHVDGIMNTFKLLCCYITK